MRFALSHHHRIAIATRAMPKHFHHPIAKAPGRHVTPRTAPGAGVATWALALPAGVVLVAAPALAQTVQQAPQPVAQQQVEVVGTTPLPGLDVPKDHIAGHVQTARGDEIERSRALDLTQFMNRRLGSARSALPAPARMCWMPVTNCCKGRRA